MNFLEFNLKTLVEMRGVALDVIDEGLIEHTPETLSILRSIVPEHRQSELDFIEERLTRSSKNRPRLHAEILASVYAVLKLANASRILDVGSGEGMLIRALASSSDFEKIVGVDQDSTYEESARALIGAVSPHALSKVVLTSNSDYKELINDYSIDAVVLVEIIEHIIDKNWIHQFFRLQPDLIIVTTPNYSYNVLTPPHTLESNGLRNKDHKFEFTTQEFIQWAHNIGDSFKYTVDLLPIGPADIEHGSSGLMAVFQRDNR